MHYRGKKRQNCCETSKETSVFFPQKTGGLRVLISVDTFSFLAVSLSNLEAFFKWNSKILFIYPEFLNICSLL